MIDLSTLKWLKSWFGLHHVSYHPRFSWWSFSCSSLYINTVTYQSILMLLKKIAFLFQILMIWEYIVDFTYFGEFFFAMHILFHVIHILRPYGSALDEQLRSSALGGQLFWCCISKVNDILSVVTIMIHQSIDQGIEFIRTPSLNWSKLWKIWVLLQKTCGTTTDPQSICSIINITPTYADNTKAHYRDFVLEETRMVYVVCIITHQQVHLKSNTSLHWHNIGIQLAGHCC